LISPRQRRAVVAVLAGALGLVIVGCTEEDTQVTPSEPCSAAMARAANATEVDEQIALLDKALVVCRSVSAFDQQMSRYPNIVGFDPLRFVENRCTTVDEGDVRRSTICSTFVTTTTTVPAELPDVVYVGLTLDGREVEIRPRPEIPFTEGRPAAVVQIVDIATEDGCEGPEAEFDRWRQRTDDAAIGDAASVFAQHALNVMAFMGCDR
jgi:hypothetical protein